MDTLHDGLCTFVIISHWNEEYCRQKL